MDREQSIQTDADQHCQQGKGRRENSHGCGIESALGLHNALLVRASPATHRKIQNRPILVDRKKAACRSTPPQAHSDANLYSGA
jgi:hypothetical protein